MTYALDAALIIAATIAWYFGVLGFATLNEQTMWWCIGISVVGLSYLIAGHWTIHHTRLGMETVFVLGLVGTMFGIIKMAEAAQSGGDIYTMLPMALIAFTTTLTGAIWGLVLRHQSWMNGDRS